MKATLGMDFYVKKSICVSPNRAMSMPLVPRQALASLCVSVIKDTKAMERHVMKSMIVPSVLPYAMLMLFVPRLDQEHILVFVISRADGREMD